MEFAILGPVEARVDGAALPLGGPKQRALLAILLLDANAPVSRDRLIAGLWGERPPPSAAQSLDSYVSRLRRVLGTDRIVRRAPGYLVAVEPGELDLDRFEQRLVGGPLAARGARRCGAGRRSPTCSTSRSPAREAERLEERRLLALEERVDADLAAGARRRARPELDALVHEHPLRERLIGQLHARPLPRRPPGATRSPRCGEARRRLAASSGSRPARGCASSSSRSSMHDPALARRPAGCRAPAAPAPDGRSLVCRVGARRSRAAAAALLIGAGDGRAGPAAARAGPTARSRSTPATGDRTACGRAARRRRPQRSPRTARCGSRIPTTSSSCALDPDSGQIVDRIPMADQPGALAAGGGAMWVAGHARRRGHAHRPGHRRVTQTVALGSAQPGRDRVAGRGASGSPTRRAARSSTSTRAPARCARTHPLDAAPDGARRARPTPSGSPLRRRRRRAESTRRPGARCRPCASATGRPRSRRRAARCGWPTRSTRRSRGSTRGTGARDGDDRGRQRPGRARRRGEAALWVASQYAGTRHAHRHRRRPRHAARSASAAQPATVAVAGGRVWAAAGPSPTPHRGGTLRLLTTQPLRTIDPGLQFTLEPAAVRPPRLRRARLASRSRRPGRPAARPGSRRRAAAPARRRDARTRSGCGAGIRYSDGRPLRARRLPPRDRAAVPAPLGRRGLLHGRGRRAACVSARGCALAGGIVTDDRAGTVTFRLRAPDPDFLFKLTVFGYAAPIPPGVPDRDAGRDAGPRHRALPGRELVRDAAPPRPQPALPRVVARRAAGRQPRRDRPGASPTSFDAAARAVERGEADWLFGAAPAARGCRRCGSRIPAQVRENRRCSSTSSRSTRTRRRSTTCACGARSTSRSTAAKIARMYGARRRRPRCCQALLPGLPGHRPLLPLPPRPRARAGARGRVGHARAAVDVWGMTDELVPPARAAGLRRRRCCARSATARRCTARRPRAHAGAAAQHPALGRRRLAADYPAPSAYLPQFFGCHGGLRNGYVCDRELDRLMARATALQLRDPGRAAAAWAAVDRRITDRGAVGPDGDLRRPSSSRSGLRNYQFHPVWGFIADQAWLR